MRTPASFGRGGSHGICMSQNVDSSMFASRTERTKARRRGDPWKVLHCGFSKWASTVTFGWGVYPRGLMCRKILFDNVLRQCDLGRRRKKSRGRHGACMGSFPAVVQRGAFNGTSPDASKTDHRGRGPVPARKECEFGRGLTFGPFVQPSVKKLKNRSKFRGESNR